MLYEDNMTRKTYRFTINFPLFPTYVQSKRYLYYSVIQYICSVTKDKSFYLKHRKLGKRKECLNLILSTFRNSYFTFNDTTV